MKNLTITILIASLAVISLTSPVRARIVTADEALTVAENWVTLIIQLKGDWGGAETAEVDQIQEFKRGNRVIGYFCQVNPKGFIVISLQKGLAPVKAYSATCDIDPELDKGITAIVKGKMINIIDAIENRLGPIRAAGAADIESILEINYRGAWDEFGGNNTVFKQDLESGAVLMNYAQGQVLLSSSWHQEPPYNNDCPDKGCDWSSCQIPPTPYGCNQNAWAGCVAIAGAQVMRYWCWPPTEFHNYDWPNMLDEYRYSIINNRFQDSSGNPCTVAQIDAVAELCHSVGTWVDTDYGCDGSSAYTYHWFYNSLFDVFNESLRYSCSHEHRSDYSSAIDWFEFMKQDFNQNRPLVYKCIVLGGGHSLVTDGWQKIGSLRQYHMNYGWGGVVPDPCEYPEWSGYTSSNTWYTLDSLPGSDLDDELLLGYLRPASALYSTISGDYFSVGIKYRYFDQDATGDSAAFWQGQKLQFLPGITVTCTSTEGDYIRFIGINITSSDNTYLFSRGDLSKGARLIDSEIRLYKNGSIKFY